MGAVVWMSPPYKEKFSRAAQSGSEHAASVLNTQSCNECHGVRSNLNVLGCLNARSGEVRLEKDPGKNVYLGATGNIFLILERTGLPYIAEASPNVYKEICRSRVLEKKIPKPIDGSLPL